MATEINNRKITEREYSSDSPSKRQKAETWLAQGNLFCLPEMIALQSVDGPFHIPPLAQLITQYCCKIPTIQEAIGVLEQLKPILETLYGKGHSDEWLLYQYCGLWSPKRNHFLISTSEIGDELGIVPKVTQCAARLNDRCVVAGLTLSGMHFQPKCPFFRIPEDRWILQTSTFFPIQLEDRQGLYNQTDSNRYWWASCTATIGQFDHQRWQPSSSNTSESNVVVFNTQQVGFWYSKMVTLLDFGLTSTFTEHSLLTNLQNPKAPPVAPVHSINWPSCRTSTWEYNLDQYFRQKGVMPWPEGSQWLKKMVEAKAKGLPPPEHPNVSFHFGNESATKIEIVN